MAELTAAAELDLYESDRPAWLAYVAPRMAARLALLDDAVLGDNWACLARDYQRTVWPLLDSAVQQRIRAARGNGGDDYAVRVPTHQPIPHCPQPDQGNAAEALA